jgi:hypothetical protein
MRTMITRCLIASVSISFGCAKGGGDPAGRPPLENPSERPGDMNMMPNPTVPSCVGDFPEGCIANCAAPLPEGMRCHCQITNCEATEVKCSCDVGCYPDANGEVADDCDIQTGPDGTSVSGELGDALGECAGQLSCTEENDLSTTLECSITDCEMVEPEVVMVEPNAPSVSPSAPSASVMRGPMSAPVRETAERQATSVDVLFVVDNSASMGDDQLAASCAVDSFFNAVDAGGGTFRAGVLTTDMLGDDPTGRSNTNASSYPCDRVANGISCSRPPQLAGLDGACSATLSCQCPATNPATENVCNFNDAGDWINSSDPAGRELLRKLIVQGELGSWYENGLETAFQYFVALERAGLFDGTTPTQIVIVADEDADAAGPNGSLMCPFNTVSRNIGGLANFSPPAANNSLASCRQDLVDFYGYYFASRNIKVHGLTYTLACGGTNTEAIGEVYQGVIQRTGGLVTSICDCGSFPGFFTEVGRDTAELSTSICLSAVPEAGSLSVTYTEQGSPQPVPESSTDGWSYDATRNCVVLHGSWADRFGSFQLDYYDQNAPMTEPIATGCLPPGTPIAMPIVLSCNGVNVPEGWTFDQVTGCFTFRGSWADSCTAFELNPVACGFSLADPLVTEIFCGDQLVPRSVTDGWSSVPRSSECIGLYGSWAEATCTFSNTPKVCPVLSGPAPVPESLKLTCDGADVPASASDGWVHDAASGCFYLYGSWATKSCAWAVSYIPSNNATSR